MQHATREKGYYLPLSYNDNKIVLLVRDPQYLFAYWDISDDRWQNFINQFGPDSWNNSRPVIKLINVSSGTVRFIEVNDFASNWYIEVNDANCAYSAEFGRMFNSDFFVSFATSNTVKTPSDRPSDNEIPVLFADYRAPKTTREVKIKPDLGKYEQKLTEQTETGISSLSISGVSSGSLIK